MKVESNLVALQYISSVISLLKWKCQAWCELNFLPPPSSLSSSFSKALLKTSKYLSWLTRFYPAHTSFNLILSQDSVSNLEKSWAWFASTVPPLALSCLPAKGRWGTARDWCEWKSCWNIWLFRANTFSGHFSASGSDVSQGREGESNRFPKWGAASGQNQGVLLHPGRSCCVPPPWCVCWVRVASVC